MTMFTLVLEKTLKDKLSPELSRKNTHTVAHGWRAILCLLAYLDDSAIAEAAVIKGTTMESVMMIDIPLHAMGKEGGRQPKTERMQREKR